VTKITWSLVHKMSALLEDAEREVVVGDLIESGEPAGEALFQTFGLVARRQLELWQHWRPWLALLALALPLAIALGTLARRLADHSAIYAWLYANNWTNLYVTNAAARTDLLREGGWTLASCSLLAGAAWAAGLVAARTSRRTAWINGALLCLGGLIPSLLINPDYPPWHSAVFALPFYRIALPVIVQTALVCIPALWAVRFNNRLHNI